MHGVGWGKPVIYHCTSIKMAKMKTKPDNRKCCQAYKWNPHPFLMGTQNGTATWEDSWLVPYEVKYTLTI